MTISGHKTVWVHSWYTPGSDAGFDWYTTEEAATLAYDQATPSPGETHYLFPYETEADESPDETTNAIDIELDEASDNAAVHKSNPAPATL